MPVPPKWLMWLHDRLLGVGARLLVGVGDIDPAGDVDVAGRRVLAPLARSPWRARACRARSAPPASRRRAGSTASGRSRCGRSSRSSGRCRPPCRAADAASGWDAAASRKSPCTVPLKYLPLWSQRWRCQASNIRPIASSTMSRRPSKSLPRPSNSYGPVARADAQPHAAVRQDVDERGVLDHADRVVERQRDDRGADVDAAGLGREIGHVGEAVRHDAVAGGEVVLGDPGGVVAQPLGLDDFFRCAGVHLAVRIGLFLGIRMRGETERRIPWFPRLFVELSYSGHTGGPPWHSTSSSRTA